MKLKILDKVPPQLNKSDASVVHWLSDSEFVLLSSRCIQHYKLIGYEEFHCISTSNFPTPLSFLSSTLTTNDGKSSGVPQTRQFFILIGCTDGSILIFSLQAILVKKFVAHEGHAITALSWNLASNVLASGTESGCIKLWSNVYFVKLVLSETGPCIYSLTWSFDGKRIAYTNNERISIVSTSLSQAAKSYPASSKYTWTAHDAIVISLSWHSQQSLLLSCCEKGEVRLWRITNCLQALNQNSYLSSSKSSQCESHRGAIVTRVSWLNFSNHYFTFSSRQASILDSKMNQVCRVSLDHDSNIVGCNLFHSLSPSNSFCAVKTLSRDFKIMEIGKRITKYKCIRVEPISNAKVHVFSKNLDLDDEVTPKDFSHIITYCVAHDRMVLLTLSSALIYTYTFS